VLRAEELDLFDIELVDLAEVNLPFFGARKHPRHDGLDPFSPGVPQEAIVSSRRTIASSGWPTTKSSTSRQASWPTSSNHSACISAFLSTAVRLPILGRLGFDPQVACEREAAAGADRSAVGDFQEHGCEGDRVGGFTGVLEGAGCHEFRAVRAAAPADIVVASLSGNGLLVLRWACAVGGELGK